jgi:hypothetical protein
MSEFIPPVRPGPDASNAEIDRYNSELRIYKLNVEQTAEEIQTLCRDLFKQCDDLSNASMRVMESTSATIWQGSAAMDFYTAGSNQKVIVNDIADDLREMVANVMKQTNAKLSSI